MREVYEVKNLVLFYVEKSDVSKVDLGNFLKNKLPKYMVPSYYIPLEKFPLSPNGKLNRIALREYELPLENNRPVLEPRNETERALLNIWKNVFHTDKIGIQHSLFDFGNNSLTIFRIMSQVYSLYEVNIPLSFVNEHPSVLEWADYINREKNQKVENTEKYQRGVL